MTYYVTKSKLNFQIEIKLKKYNKNTVKAVSPEIYNNTLFTRNNTDVTIANQQI